MAASVFIQNSEFVYMESFDDRGSIADGSAMKAVAASASLTRKVFFAYSTATPAPSSSSTARAQAVHDGMRVIIEGSHKVPSTIGPSTIVTMLRRTLRMTTLITVLDLEVAGASASSGTPFDAGLVRLAWPVGGGDAGTLDRHAARSACQAIGMRARCNQSTVTNVWGHRKKRVGARFASSVH